MQLQRSGKCYCGAVQYETKNEWTGVINCHCKDCQQLHGIYNPMVAGSIGDITFTKDDGLEWYQSSEKAERGFCKVCGSAMFKRVEGEDKFLISVGNLDDTSGLKTIKNVWLEGKGGYYVVPPEEPEIASK